jgi:hypothetical protein
MLESLRAETNTLLEAEKACVAGEGELLRRLCEASAQRLDEQDRTSFIQKVLEDIAASRGTSRPRPFLVGVATAFMFNVFVLMPGFPHIARVPGFTLGIAGAAALWLLVDAWSRGKAEGVRDRERGRKSVRHESC